MCDTKQNKGKADNLNAFELAKMTIELLRDCAGVCVPVRGEPGGGQGGAGDGGVAAAADPGQGRAAGRGVGVPARDGATSRHPPACY